MNDVFVEDEKAPVGGVHRAHGVHSGSVSRDARQRLQSPAATVWAALVCSVIALAGVGVALTAAASGAGVAALSGVIVAVVTGAVALITTGRVMQQNRKNGTRFGVFETSSVHLPLGYHGEGR
ncbi:MAG: hypothetical protein GX542_04895 [Rhodococcus sp.]|nr:hypothetical protein [Rhodococcus sp. (in: high G+C Gram-positive bacteria)]